MTKGEQTKVDMMMAMLERHMDNSDKHYDVVSEAIKEHGEAIATLNAQQQANVEKISNIRSHGKYIWALILSLFGVNIV